MKMKILTFAAILALMLTSCANAAYISDTEEFRHDYEILNGQITLDGQHTYQTLEVPEELSVVHLDSEEMDAFLTEGTGVLYLGFPECPWCRTLLPVLFEALETSESPVAFYYYDAQQDRDSKYLDEDGNIVVEKEGTALYGRLLEKLDAHLYPYPGLDDPSIKRIFFPTTVFLRDGEVLGVHCATVESQTDGYEPLTSAQHDELLTALSDSLAAITAR